MVLKEQGGAVGEEIDMRMCFSVSGASWGPVMGEGGQSDARMPEGSGKT